MSASATFSASSVSKLLAFAEERHRIYLRRKEGQEKPWTTDPVLQRYRFCNIYRELDKVTRWIDSNIRTPYEDHPNLWFMLAIARQINWPDTLAELRWPVNKYDPERLKAVLQARKLRKEQVYTGAYMLNCNWHPDWKGERDKATFTADLVLQSVWKAKRQMPKQGSTLLSVAEFLQKGHGWGSFTAAQVVADLKYAESWVDASDWYTFALSGPGSRRGMAIVAGKEARSEQEWYIWLMELQELFNARWHFAPLHAQDLQNTLCEYSKYCRGTSRSKYDGT